ncbi:MAG: tryptophan synthase subunit alpha [Nitrospinota bacterium]
MQRSSRLAACFERLRAEGRAGLFPFATAGDPDLAFTRELLPALARAGADGFELGVPFSDPLADGPTIQRSSMRALQGGTRLKDVLALVGEVRRELAEAPIVLMTYYNPIIAFGEGAFAREAARAGADGVIVPDLPPEEAGELLRAMRDFPLDAVFMLAPTSTPSRVELVNGAGSGFIYYVGQMGVTGARDSLDAGLRGSLERLRAVKNRPVLVGFGIKTPEQAADAGENAEGVIVGSALADVMEKEADRRAKLQAASRYVEALRKALDEAAAARPGGAGRFS